MAGYSIKLTIVDVHGTSLQHRMSQTGLVNPSKDALLKEIRERIAQDRGEYAGTGKNGAFEDTFQRFDLDETSVTIEGIGRLPNAVVFNEAMTVECERALTEMRRQHTVSEARRETFDTDFQALFNRLKAMGFQEGRDIENKRRWVRRLYTEEVGNGHPTRGIVRLALMAHDVGEIQVFHLGDANGKPGYYTIREMEDGIGWSDGVEVPISDPDRVIAMFDDWAARIGLEVGPFLDTAEAKP